MSAHWGLGTDLRKAPSSKECCARQPTGPSPGWDESSQRARELVASQLPGGVAVASELREVLRRVPAARPALHPHTTTRHETTSSPAVGTSIRRRLIQPPIALGCSR